MRRFAVLCLLLVVLAAVLSDGLQLLLIEQVEENIRDAEAHAETERHAPAKALLVLPKVVGDQDKRRVASRDQHLHEAQIPVKNALADDFLDLEVFE